MIENITARIYWDTQDKNNTGWAWATRVNGEFDNTGSLDGITQDDSPTDAELISALRKEALNAEASAALSDEDVEIVR